MTDNKNIRYFNEKTRDKYWKKYGDKFKRTFRCSIKSLIQWIDDEEMTKLELEQGPYRLYIGYYGISKQSGVISGIKSVESTKPKVKKINDHIIGATKIGEIVHKALEDCNRDLDYMVNTWLYENLWLWMTIKVSYDEHKKENISRNEHTVEEKLELTHYNEVSELLYPGWEK
jgi:hypothetical protein